MSALRCAEEQSPVPAIDGEGSVEKTERKRTGVQVGPLLNNGSFKFAIGLDALRRQPAKTEAPKCRLRGAERGPQLFCPHLSSGLKWGGGGTEMKTRTPVMMVPEKFC